MRNLIVAAQEFLAPDITDSLVENAWELTYLQSAGSAQCLEGDQDFSVGLAVFPELRQPADQQVIQQIVFSLPAIKWVGVLSRGDLRDSAMKRFIADALYDFQVFPLHGERLTLALGHAHGMAMIQREVQGNEVAALPARLGMIGDSPVMRQLYRVLEHAAESDVPVLITGPTGTGKEKAARAIHENSARAHGPFVALNCAAIPPTLIQAELFGYVKGAFTDASEGKMGHIEAASGGTLFLDEIGDMPFESQATLLRFLEDKVVTPLGSTRSKHVDVRVIASTNRDLEAAIRDQVFRADLFYRLAVLFVRTPALSRREDDIEVLANYFLAEAIAVVRNAPGLRFAKDALTAMRHYSWPGNLRELRSSVLQSVFHCPGSEIRAKDLNLGGAWNRGEAHLGEDHETLEDARNLSEKRRLEAALALNGSNVSRTAQDLKVSRMTMYRLMAKHGLLRNTGT